VIVVKSVSSRRHAVAWSAAVQRGRVQQLLDGLRAFTVTRVKVKVEPAKSSGPPTSTTISRTFGRRP
jgi:hypothetical protein